MIRYYFATIHMAAIFNDQMGQFIMCQGPLWAKFNVECTFRQSQGVHTGCSS